ncbi:hypothetical protein F5X68DRAFT_234559 [Plectosphaerella plurivora]|uniref:BZIP domain-containing protein n=1 Tax=Plectosphaerella plurivora TaxID=936078 RepID=A0A9P8V7Y9_9PEZI|nr:hypothetical protein F5X68DRAFT_234559 [Plectosphaerella plurivora]
MDFPTPRPTYTSAPPGFFPMPTEDDVFAAQFAAFVGTEPLHHQYSTSSVWSSSASSPSYSIDAGAMMLDSADESASSSSTEGHDAASSKKSKRASRYKECTEEVLVRRREQNRANQRAYRMRKEQRLQELQDQLDQMNQKNEALACSCSVLSKECARLRARLMPAQQASEPQGLDLATLAAYYSKMASVPSPTDPCLDYTGSNNGWSS